jgi:hypothetical protein
MQGAQIRWWGQPAGLPDVGRLGEPPLPFATTKLKRNAADGLFTKPSSFFDKGDDFLGGFAHMDGVNDVQA